MQNIHVFRHSSEIQRFFHGLWKTEYFRDQHATRGTYIHEVMHRVARYPLFIYTMSEHPSADVALRERTEAKHFSPWWGGIVRYELDHPLTHDLCWLHDLAHRAYAQYDPAASFESFSVRTRALERKATIISNLVPYLDRPSLRTMIDEPLLVDRFLQDSQFMMLWHLAGAQTSLIA